MILYFAGGAHEETLRGGDILESFWYRRDAIEAMTHAGHFFLDSGAFTAFTKKVTIDLDEYSDFVKLNKEHISVASSLDAIGDPQKTYDNFHAMLAKGADVIPVFHCREDFSWLRRYVKEGHPYIALGGMVPEGKAWVAKWLDQVWSLLVDEHGRAKVKVHGFGMTVLSFIQKYPWYSFDSSSWTYGSRFGYVLTMWPNGKQAWVFVGEKHSARKDWGERHYSTFSPPYQHYFDQFCSSIGVADVAGMRADAKLIDRHNIAVFKSWIKGLATPRFIPHAGLFDHA